MKILSKYLNTRNKQVASGIAVTAILGISGVGVYAYNSSKVDLLKLKKDIVTIEYGQSISLSPEKYLDISNLDTAEKSDIIKNTVVKSSATKEESKEYPSVGEYKLTISYGDEEKIVKVVVKDTIIPLLNVPDSIEIVQGTDISKYDFESLMNAIDLAELNDYVIDVSMIDTNKPAEYMGKVSVDDVNGNKAEKEFKVVIKSAPKSDEEAVEEKVKNSDGTTSVRTTVKKKITEPSNSSKNNNTQKSNSSDKNPSNQSESSNTNKNNGSDGRTEINTNKTGETDLGDGGTGESYEGFEWPSDWD